VHGSPGQEQAAVVLDQGTDHGDRSGGRHADWLNKEMPDSATFLGLGCFSGMKTFLKILLVAVLLIVAIKLSPVVFVAALIGLLVAAVLGAIGLSLVAGLLAVVIALTAALAPIWIPVLAIMGAISLFKKLSDRREPPVMAA